MTFRYEWLEKIGLFSCPVNLDIRTYIILAEVEFLHDGQTEQQREQAADPQHPARRPLRPPKHILLAPQSLSYPKRPENLSRLFTIVSNCSFLFSLFFLFNFCNFLRFCFDRTAASQLQGQLGFVPLGLFNERIDKNIMMAKHDLSNVEKEKPMYVKNYS